MIDYIKKNHLSLLIILWLGIAGLTGGGSEAIAPLGALDRTTVSNPWTFAGAVTHSGAVTNSGATTLETLTQGGGTRATSTDDTSATLLASDFDVENVIEFTPNVTGITLTLPATSTLTSFIPNSSDCRDITILNATTTAGTGFTLAGGTGTLLRKASTTAIVLPGGFAELRMCRKADTDIGVMFNNHI